MKQTCTGYESNLGMSRRGWLSRFGMGLGGWALSDMLGGRLLARTTGVDENSKSRGVMKALHHPAKAKRVIFLFQSGGPSQIDLLDYKPHLNKV